MPELLLGAGSRRDKMVLAPETPEDWTSLWTVDINPRHEPTHVHDLNKYPWPYEDSMFDEVHAYELLEHLGNQGDYKAYFACFQEIWRILKPGGWLCGTSPGLKSGWLWGDPGHTRVISRETFAFLSQREYVAQVGKTAMTDYRFCYKGDFQIIPNLMVDRGDTFIYCLRAIKQGE